MTAVATRHLAPLAPAPQSLAPPTERVRRMSLLPALMSGYALLLPVQFAGPAGVRLAPSDLFIVAYFFSRGRPLRRVPRAWSSWHAGLVAVMAMGLIVAVVRTGHVSQSAVLQKVIGLLVLMLTYACVVDFARDRERLRFVLRMFVLGVVTMSVVADVAFMLGHAGLVIPLINDPYAQSRISGLLIDPNAFGGLIGVALVTHLLTARRAPLLNRATSTVAGLSLPVALVLSFSRSAWIGVGLAVAVVAAINMRHAAGAVVRLMAPLLLAVPALAAFYLPDFGSLVSRPSQVQDRVTIASSAFHEIARSPLFGMGVGAYEQTYGVIVHNTTLWFLTEFGLVGLLVFVGFITTHVAKVLWTVRRTTGADRAIATALLAGFTTCFGLSLGIEALYQRYWWLYLALGGAAYALRRGPVT